ncbi:cytosolic endo-beta-N-acetylglucosaminidase 1-like isoform X2 [Hevea brasiliensis]|uniref:cytosolic endo-beta-N-acetylglucosaminidase 1-like isoform X2 n=1 Tax=Hevea brasiliensis TaxID=3981 RepID=UPI0025CC9744|nr:cytosolic endo-beta-N-acetylglucosaminidase 1-like isoform X2 [Hevea brasiliensis]
MLIALLRTYVDRPMLLSLYNFLILILKKILFFFPFLDMSQSNDLQQQSSAVDPPPFDPIEPSTPVSYPIKTLEELESQAYFDSFHYPFNISSVSLPSSALYLPNRPRLLVCHDMQGGYGDDKWVQGGSNPEAYVIWHWYLIDVFVYFSHYLVSLPPPCWTNTAHRHGVKVLGTFLTEWDEGGLICNKLLETEESARMYAKRLVELAVALGFDGWLTNVALEVLKNDNVSAAIFAPGWLYETQQLPDFWTAQNRWWTLVEKSWGLVNKYPKTLPFYSNFDQGHGYHISVEGQQVMETSWNNMSCQGLQPFLESIDGPTPETIQVLVDVKEASYNGGGNITFKGFLEDSAVFTTRLFLAELPLGNQPLHLTYSVKSDGDSQLGLSLQFSSTNGERTSVLTASGDMYKFPSKFSKVIMAHPVRKPEMDPGWVVYEGRIEMNECILTEIHAVCYKLKPKNGELRSEHKIDGHHAKFFSTLGHVAIKNSEGNFCMPPSSLWLVEGQNIKISSDSQGSKIVSVKIIWKLKDGNDFMFPSYNIYVVKLAKQVEGNPGTSVKGVYNYLGVTQVTAFYVSDLSVPSGTCSLKFIIQACDFDGACQKLDDSPYFQLDIEGQ